MSSGRERALVAARPQAREARPEAALVDEEVLLARLADDEAVAGAARPRPWALERRAEHEPHAQMWPHGTARCDLGCSKQTMHVVSPPMVDSGGSARRGLRLSPSTSASARDAPGGAAG